MVFFELLPRNQTINPDVSCRHLNKLNAVVKEKRAELVNRKGVIFHHDNATPHRSLSTHQELSRLSWEVMLHPLYSLDLTPSDYYLFLSLQNSLNDKTFNDDEAVKSHLVQFFADNEQKFYEHIIGQGSFLVFKKCIQFVLKNWQLLSEKRKYPYLL